MNATALIIIDSDPRASGRPAEALRIAAGVAAWKKVGVAVYLRGAAARVLDEDADGLVDGENIVRYLQPLLQSGRGVFVQSGATSAGRAAGPVEEVSDAQLAAMAAARECVLRF
jgi:hypothetical protein